MFCKLCGKLLVPKITQYGKWMACPDGHIQPELNQEGKFETVKGKREQVKKVEVVEHRNLLAVHDHKCKKCGYGKAELIDIMPSYSDEENTFKMKCGKCGFVEQLEGKVK